MIVKSDILKKRNELFNEIADCFINMLYELINKDYDFTNFNIKFGYLWEDKISDRNEFIANKKNRPRKICVPCEWFKIDNIQNDIFEFILDQDVLCNICNKWYIKLKNNIMNVIKSINITNNISDSLSYEVFIFIDDLRVTEIKNKEENNNKLDMFIKIGIAIADEENIIFVHEYFNNK